MQLYSAATHRSWWDGSRAGGSPVVLGAQMVPGSQGMNPGLLHAKFVLQPLGLPHRSDLLRIYITHALKYQSIGWQLGYWQELLDVAVYGKNVYEKHLLTCSSNFIVSYSSFVSFLPKGYSLCLEFRTRGLRKLQGYKCILHSH